MRHHCRPDGTSVAMGIVDDGSLIGKMPPPKEHIVVEKRLDGGASRVTTGLHNMHL